MDPDGRMDVYYQEAAQSYVITANHNDKNDMALAAQAFSDLQERGENVFAITTGSNGASVRFNNADAMININSRVEKGFDLDEVINLASSISGTLSNSMELMQINNAFTKNFVKGAKIIGVGAVIIDGVQVFNDPNFDTGSDFVISIIGMKSGYGTLISVSLSYSKIVGKKYLTDLAIYNIHLKNYFTDMAIDAAYETIRW